MQDLFAAQISIRNSDPDDTFAALGAEACAWAWRGQGPPPDPALEPDGQRAAPNDYAMQWTTITAPGTSDRALEVVLRHPDPDTPGRHWRAVADICRRASSVTVTVRVSREATQLFVAPAPATIRRPSLLPTVLKGFASSAGDLPVSASPSVVHVDGVAAFVRDVLRAEGRVLPVVILAPSSGATRLPTDPTRLANELAGLAHVVVLGGYLAWDRFRDTVGTRQTVPFGGIRLYWPGFGLEGDRLHHKLWTRRRLQDDATPAQRVLASMLARISVHAVPRDTLPRELRRISADAHRREAAARNDLQELVAIFEAENAELQRETEQQTERIAELHDRVAGLERDLAAQQASWATVTGYAEQKAQSDADEEALEDGVAFSPQTWAEFVEHLDALVSPAFVLTERAREMCDPSPYPDPARMWWHLERLAEAAEAWAAANCAVGRRLEEWIPENYGIEVVLHDANLGAATAFRHDGKEYSREPHVKVDDYVDPARCGRIYFAYDSDRGRFIVDHIGLHL